MELCENLIIMKYIISLFILLSSFFSTHAQNGSMSGTIVDKKTGETLIGAVVRVTNTSLGGVTDLNGKYSIKNIPVGNYEIAIGMMSYEKLIEKIEIKVGQNSNLDVSLGTLITEKKE